MPNLASASPGPPHDRGGSLGRLRVTAAADELDRLREGDASPRWRIDSAGGSRPAQVSRSDRLSHLDPSFRDQLGVVRRAQLYESGWTRHHVEHEIRYGRWQLAAPEVVVLHNGPLTYEQRLWVGILHTGSAAALSHATTLKVNSLEHWDPPLIDVISPRGNTVEKLEGFFFHETRRDYCDWIHPTRRPRQLRIEEACLLAAERKRSARSGIGLVAACVQQRLTVPDRLFASSLTVSKLRHGHQIRLAVLDIAGGAHSFAEIDIARVCRHYGLRQPTRQQFRLDRSGRRRYLDCEWDLEDGTKIVLEIDGAFHREAENWWRDMQRERSVVIEVGRVLRCSTIEIRLEPEQIASDLLAVGVPRQF